MTDAAAETAPCIQAQSSLMAGDYQNETQALIRSACSECRRRKQKCLRHWPCHHCGSRGVGNQCIFRTVLDVQSVEDRKAQIDKFLLRMKGKCYLSHPLGEEINGGSDNTGADLQQFGYGVNQEQELKYNVQYCASPADCPQLQAALQTFPSRRCLDALVNNYLNDVNFYYYIVHPTVFRQEYNQWWDDRDNEKPLGVQWTSLLLMACACSAQYPNDAIIQALQIDQEPSTPKLSRRLHNAGQELFNAIPHTAAYSHIHTVQQLLLSVTWLKTRICYYECLDVLNKAIQEARPIGAHCEAASRAISSDYDGEMGRRAWVIINILDWQIATLLSRSRILALATYDIQLPITQLSEGLKESSRSPIVSMALQCGLAESLSKEFNQPRILNTADEAEEFEMTVTVNQGISLPHLAVDDPDEDLDTSDIWLDLQLFISPTMRLSAVLALLRPYLIKQLSRASPGLELESRHEGLTSALRYINKLFQFLRYIFPHKKYPTVAFLIFDVATLLCSAIIHDSDSSLPMRELTWSAVHSSVNMLGKLKLHAPIANKAYEVLKSIYDEMLGQRADDDDNTRRRKRPRLMPAGYTLPIAEPYRVPPSGFYFPGYDFTFEIPRIERLRGVLIRDANGHAIPQHPEISQPQSNNEATATTDASSSSSSTENATTDGNHVIPTQVNISTQLVQQMPVVMPPSVEYVEYWGEPSEFPKTVHSSPDSDLGVLEGLWDYDRVNLEFMSPYNGN